jgi:chorismate-pyruvate lyase
MKAFKANPTLPLELSPLLASSLLGETPLAWTPETEIPHPYHQLLVHDHDMTSELANFHGDTITLTVLQAQQSGSKYHREVTLHTATTGTTVEYGLIEILLDSFPADLRTRILAGNTPLGAILNSSGLDYRSEPQGFFTVPSETLTTIFPESTTGKILYGRYNHLITVEKTILARILEILPHQPLPPITDH